MNLAKIKNNIPIIITTIIILGFFIGLLKNINYINFPNSDFFQYIGDGQQYLKFKLPHSIHPPPFGPIIICLISKLFTNIEYPELFSAHIINIICATLTLLNIFLIFSKKRPWLGLSIILLTATNKIFITTSLNITNEVIFSYFLTLTLLLYSRKYYKLSYFLSGFSFFIRYEAIIIPIAIFIIEFFNKSKKIKFSHLAIAFTPIFFWLVILNSHSLGSSIFQNAYIEEIIISKNKIPNFDPLNSILPIIVSNPTAYFINTILSSKINLDPEIFASYLNNIFCILTILICLISIFSKSKETLTKIIYLIFPLLLLFPTLFPNFSIRYLFPTIWIIYFVFLNRKNKNTLVLLLILGIILNYFTLNKYSPYYTSEVKSEYKITNNWINNQKFKNQTIFFAYDPRLLIYFNKNDSIIFDFNSYEDTSNIFTKCKNDILCVIQNNSLYNDKDIYVVTQNTTTIELDKIKDKYTEDTLHHISAFHDDQFTKNSKFKLIKILNNEENKYIWAKIYKYIPQKIPSKKTEGI